MNKIISLFIAALSLMTISCDEMRQDMVFQKDGSGNISFKMVMNSETMEMLMMMGVSEEDVEGIDAQTIYDQFRDTSMILYDLIPDSISNDIEDFKSLRNWVMSVDLDSVEQTLSFIMNISFKSIGEFRNTLKSMSELTNEGLEGGLNSAQIGGMIDTSFNWEPGHISWRAADLSNNPEYKNLMKEMGGEEGEEAISMIEMFIGDLTFDLSITAPGEVYKCICPYGEATGNKVNISYKLIDVFKNLEAFSEDTHIYYKE